MSLSIRTLLSRSTAAAVFTIILGSPAHAQLSVDKESVMLNPALAAERTADIVVRNTGDVGLSASVQLQDWDVDSTGTSRWRPVGRIAGSCAGRVSVTPSRLQLAPGEQRVVRVAVAAGARFDRECWSAAVVQTTHAGTVAIPTNASSARATVPLYVTPSGLRADGEVSDMFVQGDSLAVIFNNTGKTRTDIVGQVQVRTAGDSVTMIIPLESATVLAGATRRLTVAMPKLAKGSYVLFGVVDFGGEQLTAAQAALEIRQ